MRIGRFRTLWIICVLVFHTGIACIKSILKYLFSNPSRSWVDKTIHQWADLLLKTAQVTYTVHNPLNVQPNTGRPTILMCNHSSAYDIPLGFKAFPNYSIRMLAKKELSKIPILGKGMSAAEFPFIDRKNRVQAMKDLEHACDLMKSGIIIWIAPEGTRSKTGKLAPFKKGAFITAIQSKAMIIPIGIRGAFNIVPGKSLNFNLQQKAEIHIGAPIDSSLFSLENKSELIAQTFTAIKQLTGEQ